ERLDLLTKMGTVVQYVVLRSDLITRLKWPLGAVIAQACHACTACLHAFRDDPYTQEYLTAIDTMHKIVLEIGDEASIEALSKTLTENNVDHKLWMEQPEEIPTCIATKPCPKDTIQKYFKKLKLFKGM
ncbi:unnamed protein product, partial [Darwinula stevensoni]